jgi:hypothetical protein
VALLGRILVILFACLLASLAAGLVVSLAVLIPMVGDLALGPYGESVLGVVVTFGALFVSAYALAPLLLVIVCAEAFAIRALLFYALGGALMGAVLYFNYSGWSGRAFTAGGFARRELEVMAAAGIVAGLVYWAIAGRTAGKWREAPPQAS